jgi:hypothetical protein
MRGFLSVVAVCLVLGLLAIPGARASGQEPSASWNSELNQRGAPVVRTNRELLPSERIEIEVAKGAQGLQVGIGRTDGSPLARIWQPHETTQGTTLSFTMSKQTQVGLGVAQGDGPLQQATVKNGKDETILNYGSGVVLKVKVIRPSKSPMPSIRDDEPAPPRWEVVEGKDGNFSIRTKEAVDLASTITIQPVKVSYARWVSVGLCWEKEDHFEKSPTRVQSASDNPVVLQVYSISAYTLKGSIRIGVDYRKPEKPTVEGFKGYDRLKFDDGTVLIVKTAKTR